MPSKKSGPGARVGAPKAMRWAVVGQGYFAQSAVLPAFAHTRGSELVALFSGDAEKRRKLGAEYGASRALPYDAYDSFLAEGEVDAVYIALPNHLHREYTVRAARAGVHVLCEKPMAPSERDCRAMIDACEDARVKLMIAYRLHFEEGNLTAVDLVDREKIGRPRYFSSAFSMSVKPGNIRTNPTEQGGGPLYDIGVYCINAARYLFQSEPTEVMAFTASDPTDERFAQSDEQVSAVLRFPDERLCSFVVSFGAADVATYTVAGTKGSVRLDPAFEYAASLKMELHIGGKTTRRSFKKRDQVAAEIDYFADCVTKNKHPEPSGWEGLHDVRIVLAILQSARTGRKVAIELPTRDQHPGGTQSIERPPVPRPPHLIRATSPSS